MSTAVCRSHRRSSHGLMPLHNCPGNFKLLQSGRHVPHCTTHCTDRGTAHRMAHCINRGTVRCIAHRMAHCTAHCITHSSLIEISFVTATTRAHWVASRRRPSTTGHHFSHHAHCSGLRTPLLCAWRHRARPICCELHNKDVRSHRRVQSILRTRQL